MDETTDTEPVEEGKDDEGVPQDIPSRELLPALAKLSSLLSHLVQLLPPRLTLPLYRQISSALSNAVVERILMPSKSLPLTLDARISQQFTPCQARRFQLDVQHGWMHVAKELYELPTVAARRARQEPTGLGKNPESPWRLLIDASEQLQ